MPKITVKIDIKKDAWNWWHACNTKSYGVDWKDRITKHLQNKIVGKPKKSAFIFLLPYLKKLYIKVDLKNKKKLIQESFEKNNDDIFKGMQTMTGKKIYRNDFTCFLTTFNRAPYDYRFGYIWLPVNRNIDSLIKTFLHELLHFQTIHYYRESIMRQLGEKDFENLKEALTVILNEEFKGLLKVKDKGYFIHQSLRNELKKLWQKEKDFKKFLDTAIELTKKELK